LSILYPRASVGIIIPNICSRLYGGEQFFDSPLSALELRFENKPEWCHAKAKIRSNHAEACYYARLGHDTGDLVFFGDSTGLFHAASAATDEILWIFDVATVPNETDGNAPPAVHEINGVEYVVHGSGDEPGNSFAPDDVFVAAGPCTWDRGKVLHQ